MRNETNHDGFFNDKLVILITGTPCVGKTTVARILASKLDAIYVNLTSLALKHNLLLGTDEIRHSKIIDERLMVQKIREIIQDRDKSIIVDGHYAPDVVPKEFITHIFVLRRDPIELKTIMKQCGFVEQKLWENLASEILDVCLINALTISKSKVCELDVSKLSVNEVIQEIIGILKNQKTCQFGTVDWLTRLENLGVLDDFLKR